MFYFILFRKKNFSVDQIECFSRAIAYINQPEFISLLDKCWSVSENLIQMY